MGSHKKIGLKPTCREVHRLVSDGLDRNLLFVERVRMWLHLVVCDSCTSFNGQMSLLRQAMRVLPVRPDGQPLVGHDQFASQRKCTMTTCAHCGATMSCAKVDCADPDEPCGCAGLLSLAQALGRDSAGSACWCSACLHAYIEAAAAAEGAGSWI